MRFNLQMRYAFSRTAPVATVFKICRVELQPVFKTREAKMYAACEMQGVLRACRTANPGKTHWYNMHQSVVPTALA
jgi:hypothetical protein